MGSRERVEHQLRGGYSGSREEAEPQLRGGYSESLCSKLIISYH